MGRRMIRLLLAALLVLTGATSAFAQSLGQAPGIGYVPTSTSVNNWTWQLPASAPPPLPPLPPQTFYCNNTGVTAPAVACPALTAVPPLGVSGSSLSVNTFTPNNSVFIGGASNPSFTGNTSIAIGSFSQGAATSSSGNISVGYNSLPAITTGAGNFGLGTNALLKVTTGGGNVGIGNGLANITTTSNNIAIGAGSPLGLATATSNSVAVGTQSLKDITTGSNNSAFGNAGGWGIQTGSNNLILGSCQGLAAALASSIVICEGAGNTRIDWGKTTASTLTLAAPVAVSGTLGANAFKSTGAVPTGNTGTCSTGVTMAGGATAGTWTSTAVCALAGTIILTAMPTQTTGYACFVSDRTTAGVVIEQTATTATSASFVVRSLPTGTVGTVANDILQYSCRGY
jgi:hypothetical protein